MPSHQGFSAWVHVKGHPKPLEELEAAIKDLWRWQWEEKVDDHWEEVERRYAQILKGGRAEKVKEKGERKWCTIM